MRLRRLRFRAVLLSLGLPALAGALHGQIDLDPRVVPEKEAVAITITGRVQHAGGSPAAGAVVVTSLGGKTVTGADGGFELALELDSDAPTLHVTAVSSQAGASASGTVLVHLAAGAPVDAGTVVIEGTTGCEPSWLPAFGIQPGVDGDVHALAVFDDGGGPALYAGGEFTSAGGVKASHLAKWDGSTWSSLGASPNARVVALAVFDDGAGAALYAGGWFTSAGGVAAKHVAKWDGSTWTSLGSGTQGYVSSFAVFDDGGGPALYAGGQFVSAGGVSASGIAQWDGSVWSPLGSGVTSIAAFTAVNALTVFDDGGGPALYAGGAFETAGGVPASHIAKWDGAAWSPVGTGLSGGCGATCGVGVYALGVFDDGGGSRLYAGGAFTSAGGVAVNRVARWDGSSWSPLGEGVSGVVRALTLFDDGGGPALYAGGDFQIAGGVPAQRVAKWDGSSWTSLDSQMSYASVLALAAFDDGGGASLYVGGTFTYVGGFVAQGIAEWDGSTWSPLGNGLSGTVQALAVFDDGGGPALYVAGSLYSIGAPGNIAKWDGSVWTALGSPAGDYYTVVESLQVFDEGGGPALYAGGYSVDYSHYFPFVSKWNGSTWLKVSNQLTCCADYCDCHVYALAVFDDGGGPALYAGGTFYTPVWFGPGNIAKWDGSSWSIVGNGISGNVLALEVFDDGGGPALHAGGNISSAGGVAASGIAKWDGATWSPLGSGVGGTVYALTVFDDGGGPALYAGGAFTQAGGIPASRIAKWDGSAWSSFAGVVDFPIRALAGVDLGQGPALYAGGSFTSAGGVAANRIARRDGATWSPLGMGVSGTVRTLLAFDDGAGQALYAGGEFALAFDSGDSHIAKWGCPALAPVPGCHGNLAALSGKGPAKIGAALALTLEGGTFASGLAFLFAGLDGTDAAGCGFLSPGHGEVLLAPIPPPLLTAQATAAGGSAAFSVAIPALSALVGLTIPFQAVHVGLLPGLPIEVSKGLAATFSG